MMSSATRRIWQLALLTTVSSFCVLPAAYAQQAADAGATSDEDSIVITGIRETLLNALEERRRADVVLDGISADDIGSTPDLNLGEALQRIPGVQINREQERRDASISVRGLPGRFTKTTLQGQSVANTVVGDPTSPQALSVGSAFGIFDAAIFGGANVIKSFTADLPAGGLAANVDLRLRSALERKPGLVLRAEVGYEETTDDYAPSFFVSGSKKLGDNFGIYGTFSYSKQTFRRDTIRVNSYNGFSRARIAELANGLPASGTSPAVAGNPAFNIPSVDSNGVANEVLYPSQIRQFSRNNQGDRISAAAGVEWKPTDTLSLRVDGIYARRSLSQSNLDIFVINGDDNTGVVTPLSTPKFVGTFDRTASGAAPTNVYVVDDVRISDVNVSNGNRNSPAVAQAWAVYPQLTFENDDWTVNIIGTYSKAFGDQQENQFNANISARTGRADVNRDGIEDTGNGTLYRINTGGGNWGNYVLDVTIPAPLLDFTLLPGESWAQQTSTTGFNLNRNFVSPGNGTTPGASVSVSRPFSATGSDRRTDRDLKGIDFDIERRVSFGPITTLKVGGFLTDESARATFQRNGSLGLQFGNITQNIIKQNAAVDGSQGDFFGGTLGGIERENFLSLDLPLLRSLIYPALRTPPPGVTFNPSAANLATMLPDLTPTSAATVTYAEILRNIPDSALGQSFPRLPLRSDSSLTNNFNSTRNTKEFYGMAKFDFSEMNEAIGVRGNFGVRYVKTDLGGQPTNAVFDFYDAINADRAARRAAGDTSAATSPLVFRPGAADPIGRADTSFEAWLPSANLIWDVTDNIVARAAYYKTFEALDLVEFSPAPTNVSQGIVDLEDNLNGSRTQTVISFSSLDIKPRESTGFDLGLSWYNRKGGVIAIGYFQKTLENDITRTNSFCPVGETITVGSYTTGSLQVDRNTGRCFFGDTLPPDGNPGVRPDPNGNVEFVRIAISQNNPDSITVKGWEFQIQQQFDFLPGPLKYTGGVANYTRVRSGGANNVRLFNVAEDVYNLIFYYDDKFLQGRIAYNWQSSIQQQGGTSFSGSASRSRPYSQLDFSGAIRPTKALEIRFEAYNILNARREEYVGFEGLPQLTSYDGRTYALSATYKF